MTQCKRALHSLILNRCTVCSVRCRFLSWTAFMFYRAHVWVQVKFELTSRSFVQVLFYKPDGVKKIPRLFFWEGRRKMEDSTNDWIHFCFHSLSIQFLLLCNQQSWGGLFMRETKGTSLICCFTWKVKHVNLATLSRLWNKQAWRFY